MMKKALIIIDIQNDYFEGGAMELHNPLEASENAKQILAQFRKDNDTIVHIQHLTMAPEVGFFLPDTKGVEIHKNVKPIKGEKVITKYYPNAFRDTDLLVYLNEQEVTDLVFVGMMTQMCIDGSVRAAKDLGFECTVIGDACATRSLEIAGKTVEAEQVHYAFLAGLSQFYAKIEKTSEYLTVANQAYSTAE